MKKFHLIFITIDEKIVGKEGNPFEVEILDKSFLKLLGTCNTPDEYFAHYPAFYAEMPKETYGKVFRRKRTLDFMDPFPHFIGMKFVISEKVKEILEELKVSKEEYYLVDIILKNFEQEKFYLFFSTMLPYTICDFPKTVFRKQNPKTDEWEYFSYNSYQEYEEKREYGIDFYKIVLPKKYEKREIINFQGTGSIFFSDRLTDEFEKQGVIGYTKITSGYYYVELIFE